MFSQVPISHLEHFVDERLDLLGYLTIDNESVCRNDANLEECSIVALLHFIKLLNDLEDLVKTEVKQLICLTLEIIVADENSVVGVHISYVIWQRILKLGAKIVYHLGKNSNLQEIVCIAPFMIFKYVNDSFNQLEKACLWVARNYN